MVPGRDESKYRSVKTHKAFTYYNDILTISAMLQCSDITPFAAIN